MLHFPDPSPLSTREKCRLPPHAICIPASSVHSPFNSSVHLADPLLLFCPQAISNCYLQPLHLGVCWHRRVLVPFQALLMCLFFNKPSSDKSHCAGSLYFTDLSSISLSSLVFRNVSNCHCTYQGIDRCLLPLLPFQYFEMVRKK